MSYAEQVAEYKAKKIGQIDASPVKRRKKHCQHMDGWQVSVALSASRAWIRRYATEEIAQRVADAYNRRFVCHPATGKPWGGDRFRAVVIPPAMLHIEPVVMP